MQTDNICSITCYYSPTCFGGFCGHHQGVMQEYEKILMFIVVHLLVCYISVNIPQCRVMEHIKFLE